MRLLLYSFNLYVMDNSGLPLLLCPFVFVFFLSRRFSYISSNNEKEDDDEDDVDDNNHF